MTARATFAAGCYWGTEKFFRKGFGKKISNVQVGFMGGQKPDPTYEEVKQGNTYHAEVLSFDYDPEQVSYDDLVRLYFRMHNPTELNRQGEDVGTQYRSAIFVYTPEQREIAEKWVAKLNNPEDEIGAKIKKIFGPDAQVVTAVVDASEFYPAHEAHQDYLTKNPDGWCLHKLYWS